MNDLECDERLDTLEKSASVCRLGLIGAGIGASLSPGLYEAEAAVQGVQCRYTLFDLDDPATGELPELLDLAEQQQFAGLNITIPCKQAVIPLLDELSPEAQAIGAVNTVRFHGQRRIGYNTDAEGFRESFIRHLQGVKLDRILQFGAGGVGAATAFTLLELGAQRLTLVDVIEAQARQLAGRLVAHFPEREVQVSLTSEQEIEAATGIVNATPIGTRKYPGSVVELDLLQPHMWVADVVYAPAETALLHTARMKGCPTLDGLSMLIHQAVRAFELFTGREADVTRMLRSYAQSQS